MVIRGARLLDHPEPVDVFVTDGLIDSIGGGRASGPQIDAGGGLLLPAFVEPHFHPDKALTHSRIGPVADLSTSAYMSRNTAVKRGFTRADIELRATAALDLAVAHGVGTMRAQVDVDTVCRLDGIHAMLAVRDRFAGLIDLQLVAFPQEAVVRDPGVEDLLRRALDLGADLLGGGPNNEDTPDHHDEHVDRLFAIAREFDVDLDLHVDFTEDPSDRALEMVARKTIDNGYEGRVAAVHCCALAAYTDPDAAATIDLVASAGIQICICPMGNLLIADTARSPAGRGASWPKDLLDAGVNVAAGSDNMSDMWFRFGRADPVDVAMVTCLAAAMRTDTEVRNALDMVTVRAARFVGSSDAGVSVGAPADLVLFSATTVDDVLRNLPGTRTTIKAGRVVGRAESRVWVDRT